jgi:hypothetical protein
MQCRTDSRRLCRQQPTSSTPRSQPCFVESNKALGLEADSARFVTQLADGVRIYAIATKTEDCVAVSFMAGGQEVTVPVTNEGQPTHGSITAHFKDGSTEPIG